MKKMKIIGMILIILIFFSALSSVAKEIEVDNEKNEELFSSSKWIQINEDGFGDEQNFATRGIEVYNDYLIVGTWNFKNLIFDKPMKPRLFLREVLYETFVNKTDIIRKYIVSNGCEIWCWDEKNWRPMISNSEGAVMPAGFGNNKNVECSVLKEYQGFLYAFVYNEKEGGQVWRTQDLFGEWEKVVEGGFGDIYNKGVMSIEILNDDLYVGTMNFENGTEIFKTNDGLQWTAVAGGDSDTESGFGTKDNYYCHSMKSYNSYLYIGTTTNKGCEIWRTNNGVNWEPIIAYRKLKAKRNGLAYSRGFEKGSIIDGIRTMIVYNDELYFGSTRLAHYRLTIMPKYFSKKFSISTPPMGAQVWKYNDNNDKWTRVVGGIGKSSNCNGFGDRENIQMWSMENYNDCIYIGTLHAESANIVFKRNGLLNWNLIIEKLKGQAELWRFDGNSWEQVVGDEAHMIDPDNPPNGFGDEYNWGFRTMKVFKNSLFVGTINFVTGCEVWRLDIS